MSGEIIRERKYVSLVGVQDHQVQCPTSCTLQPYRSTTHNFFTQDPCLYLELAKSWGAGRAQSSFPGPFSLCPGFHQFPRDPLFHAPYEISFAIFQRS